MPKGPATGATRSAAISWSLCEPLRVNHGVRLTIVGSGAALLALVAPKDGKTDASSTRMHMSLTVTLPQQGAHLSFWPLRWGLDASVKGGW